MHLVIPARYSSTRLPGKALLDIGGKPLLQWVYEKARESNAETITIATDDDRIRQAAEAFGAEVCMTSNTHQSGTDRIAEVISLKKWRDDDIVVNLQGDEPLMPASLLDQVAKTLVSHDRAVMSTACHEIDNERDYSDSDVVKVVVDKEGYALYFSRASIPWHRDAISNGVTPDSPGYRHIGLYAYRAGFVKEYAQWSPCKLETAESLEQLRVLWHGRQIAVCQATELPGHGVDTKADLERVRDILAK
ncbi:MAG: 3-deoxy-manno-octulosonate cytidylyltransferase [Acidiferrobacterales bacterium]